MINEFENFIKDWAYQKYGIKLQPHQMHRVQDGLLDLLALNHINDQQAIKRINEDSDPKFTQELVSIITVQESYFFRDQLFFMHLKNDFFPALIKSKREQNNKSIHIWSAGCSHGEEIYSIAILLRELISDISSWEIYLHGTDIQTKAIDTAKNGVYTNSALRATDQAIREKYFKLHRERYILDESVRKMVKFNYQNLAAPFFPEKNLDMIVCRNVFIYFATEIIERVLNNFFDCLNTSGVLFLGSSDFVTYCNHKFKFAQINGQSCYLKSALPTEATTKSAEISKTPSLSFIELQKERSSALKNIKKALEAQDYKKVLIDAEAYINQHGDAALLHLYKAQALISLNDQATAKDSLKKSIALDKNNPIALFFMGLIALDERDYESARSYFHRAILINSQFPEALYYMGTLMLYKNDINQGLRYFQSAYEECEKADLAKNALGTEATIGDLKKSLASEINHYKSMLNGN